MRSLLLLLLAPVLMTLAAPPVSWAGDNNRVASSATTSLIDQLLSVLEANRSDCPSDDPKDRLENYGTTWDATCATTSLSFKAVKKKFNSVLRRRDDVVRLTSSRWSTKHEYQLMRFFLDRELFVVRYDPRDGGLALLPNQSCFNPASLRNAGVLTERDAGVEAPTLLQGSPVDYPAAARVERRNGFVMVQAIVSPEGKVADACVLYVLPEGVGFDDASLKAVAFYRYEPGQHDGQPAAVLVNESVAFELN